MARPQRYALALVLCLVACRTTQTFKAGPTEVHVIGQAQPWHDLPEGMRALQSTVEALYPEIAPRVLDINLEVYPAWEPLRTLGAAGPGLMCLYDPQYDRIMARVVGEDFLDSCIIHEFLHRVLHLNKGRQALTHDGDWVAELVKFHKEVATRM